MNTMWCVCVVWVWFMRCNDFIFKVCFRVPHSPCFSIFVVVVVVVDIIMHTFALDNCHFSLVTTKLWCLLGHRVRFTYVFFRVNGFKCEIYQLIVCSYPIYRAIVAFDFYALYWPQPEQQQYLRFYLYKLEYLEEEKKVRNFACFDGGACVRAWCLYVVNNKKKERKITFSRAS